MANPVPFDEERVAFADLNVMDKPSLPKLYMNRAIDSFRPCFVPVAWPNDFVALPMHLDSKRLLRRIVSESSAHSPSLLRRDLHCIKVTLSAQRRRHVLMKTFGIWKIVLSLEDEVLRDLEISRVPLLRRDSAFPKKAMTLFGV